VLTSLDQTVDRDEVDRLRKRFMKLDKDNSGTIERDEFLSLPQVVQPSRHTHDCHFRRGRRR
jgi:Ca2+-binding EF-hand superfamily protein